MARIFANHAEEAMAESASVAGRQEIATATSAVVASTAGATETKEGAREANMTIAAGLEKTRTMEKGSVEATGAEGRI